MMFPNRTFLAENELSSQDAICELLQYDQQAIEIQTFNPAQSDDGTFRSVTGTVKNADRELDYIVLCTKLPLIDYYYVEFETVYTGGDIPSEHVMSFPNGFVKRPLFQYGVLVYTDAISVTRTINFGGIPYALGLFLAIVLLGKRPKKEP